MKLKYTIYLFAYTVLMSCSSDDANTVAPITQTPLVEFEFSAPPINVENTGGRTADRMYSFVLVVGTALLTMFI